MRPSEKVEAYPVSAAEAGIVFRFDGLAPVRVTRTLPAEVPVNVIYAPVPFAVMMTTPADLEDFAYGFSLTEGVIERASDIRGVAIEADDRGIRLTVTLTPEKLHGRLARGRNIAGRTGCGVCGIDDLDALPKARRPVREALPIRISAVRRALAILETHQPLNAVTRGVHGAAWFDADGALIAVREDVGRHNALDKLIGALLRGCSDPARGFFVITSRCSFEMVEKVASFGAGTLVAISAPTLLALERARANDVAVLAIARSDSALCLTGTERFIDDVTAMEHAS